MKALYEAIEKERNSKLLVYITGDKAGWETQIANDATDYITEHLDKIGVVPKISLTFNSVSTLTLNII